MSHIIANEYIIHNSARSQINKIKKRILQNNWRNNKLYPSGSNSFVCHSGDLGRVVLNENWNSAELVGEALVWWTGYRENATIIVVAKHGIPIVLEYTIFAEHFLSGLHIVSGNITLSIIRLETTSAASYELILLPSPQTTKPPGRSYSYFPETLRQCRLLPRSTLLTRWGNFV